MSKVYANSMEIAAKAGASKAIAAFPDVCLSPPAAPAGPVPVPYANTSHARDMKGGSKDVKIGGKPVMLADKSHYATSPLGNEAATKGLGGGFITHTITGMTYFGGWSTDVRFESEGVCRHLDLTTSNHASYPGSTPPWLNGATMNLVTAAQADLAKGRCPCCKKKQHATGAPMGRDDWYLDNMDKNAHKHGWSPAKLRAERGAYRELIKCAMARPGCTCEGKTKLLPSPPCDVFYGRQPEKTKARENQKREIKKTWDGFRRRYQLQQGLPKAETHWRQLERRLGRPPTKDEFNLARKTNHLTPKSAGGCPTGAENLQLRLSLCPACQAIDDGFQRFQ